MDQKDPHIQRPLSLLPEGSLHPGFVVCRCVLKDCLPIDKSFLGWIEAHPLEKLCGGVRPRPLCLGAGADGAPGGAGGRERAPQLVGVGASP